MPEATSTSRITRSPDETRELARRMGRAARGGEVIALSGPLGAGKTTFAKGLADGLGIDPREVTSPTFLLVHELMGRLPLWHLDAYRVGDVEELVELGMDEMIAGGGVVLVEWAERVASLLPDDRLEVKMAPGDDETSRRISLRAGGPGSLRLARTVGEGGRTP